jgi:hypothetical protein
MKSSSTTKIKSAPSAENGPPSPSASETVPPVPSSSESGACNSGSAVGWWGHAPELLHFYSGSTGASLVMLLSQTFGLVPVDFPKYMMLREQMEKIGSTQMLKEWWKRNEGEVRSMLPWMREQLVAKKDHLKTVLP